MTGGPHQQWRHCQSSFSALTLWQQQQAGTADFFYCSLTLSESIRVKVLQRCTQTLTSDAVGCQQSDVGSTVQWTVVQYLQYYCMSVWTERYSRKQSQKCAVAALLRTMLCLSAADTGILTVRTQLCLVDFNNNIVTLKKWILNLDFSPWFLW